MVSVTVNVQAVLMQAVMTGRRCAFLGESKSTLFGLLKVDAFRNH